MASVNDEISSDNQLRTEVTNARALFQIHTEVADVFSTPLRARHRKHHYTHFGVLLNTKMESMSRDTSTPHQAKSTHWLTELRNGCSPGHTCCLLCGPSQTQSSPSVCTIFYVQVSQTETERSRVEDSMLDSFRLGPYPRDMQSLLSIRHADASITASH